MKFSGRSNGWGILAAGAIVSAGLLIPASYRVLHAEGTSSPSTDPAKWNEIASDAAVAGIVEGQVKGIEKSMKSAGTFRRALKKVEITGRVLAIVGNAETIRVEGEAAKKGAALREAGLALTKAAADKKFEEAEKPLASIKTFPDSISPAGDAKPTDWKSLMDMDGLMTGVASADNELKAALSAKPDEFKKLAKEAQHWATLMAYFGRVTREHETDEQWKKWSDDMTAQSLTLAKALASKNHDEAKSARDNLLKSCEACHEAYRVEE
ncbi:hypothetical protein K2X85_17420 [bacterium]|nr:hypothetical protein [bacterium]